MPQVHLAIKDREAVEGVPEYEVLLVAVEVSLEPDELPLPVDLSCLIEVDTQLDAGVGARHSLLFFIIIICVPWFPDSFSFRDEVILLEELLVSSRVRVVC